MIRTTLEYDGLWHSVWIDGVEIEAFRLRDDAVQYLQFIGRQHAINQTHN